MYRAPSSWQSVVARHVAFAAIVVPHGFDDMHEFCNGAAGMGCGGADADGQPNVFNECMVGLALKSNAGGGRK